MVATFEFHEGNSTAPGTIGSVSNLNMGATDVKEIVVASSPISAGTNSFEKWFAGSWSGVFTKINNVQFWMNTGSFGTGEVLLWTGSETAYVEPTATTSSFALGSIPSADPGTANISVGSSLSGSLVAEGRSDWVVLQYQTTASANPGPANQKTFTLQWDEQ